MENEQNDALANARYPPATFAKITTGVHHTDHPRAPCHMDKQDRYADRKTGGFHCGMVQAADGVDVRFECCFNCLEEGHRWRDCKKKPLLPELQEILDREVFNRMGGTGNKGGCAPMNPRNGKGKAAIPTKPAQ